MNQKTERVQIDCSINGQSYSFKTYPMARLLDLIRENALLMGTKEGCGEGECGACSILLNGELVNSCLVPALQAHGAALITIEGVANGDQLHAIQTAFLETGGAQCGICTPGMILAGLSLLKKNPNPQESEIREGLAGNLCRCTGYMKIFDAIRKASQLISESS